VYGNSSRWESVYTHVLSYSANWESTYITVNSLSGSWTSVYTTTNANSSYWNDAYNNLVGNSANYLSLLSSVAFGSILSPNVYYQQRIQALDLNYASVQAAVSAIHERVNALYVMFTGLTANQSTIIVSITSNN
jgi:hypothetical protein